MGKLTGGRCGRKPGFQLLPAYPELSSSPALLLPLEYKSNEFSDLGLVPKTPTNRRIFTNSNSSASSLRTVVEISSPINYSPGNAHLPLSRRRIKTIRPSGKWDDTGARNGMAENNTEYSLYKLP